MAIHGHVSSARIERRRIDLADAAPLRHIFRSDVGPGLAFILRELNQAIVGADPEQPLLERGLRQSEDRVVVLGAGVVERDVAAGDLLLRSCRCASGPD